MNQQIPAPLVVHRATVKPEWIDYNGHLNVAYYLLIFDNSADDLFDYLGADAAYRERTNSSLFALETHITYQRELNLGDQVCCEITLLDHDEKRFHYINRMRHEAEGFIAATAEWVSMNVDMATRRSAPMHPDLLTRFEALHKAHSTLPRPPEAGRSVGLRRK